MQRTLRISRLAAALVSCALFMTVTPAHSADVYNSQFTAIAAPECIMDWDITGRFKVRLTQNEPYPAPTLNRFEMAVRYIHDVNTPITTNFGHLGTLPVTNYNPETPYSTDWWRWQRGKLNTDANTTSGFQLKCADVGSFINTWTFPYQTIIGGGPHTAYGYTFIDPQLSPASIYYAPQAFDWNPATDLMLQFHAEMPLFLRWGPPDNPGTGDLGVAQLSMFLYLYDTTSGKILAYVLGVYDNRSSWSPQVLHDSQVPFLTTPWQTNEYITVSPYSQTFRTHTWTGLQFFRLHIPQSKFLLAVTKLNEYCTQHPTAANCNLLFSNNPQSYKVMSFGVLHEVFRGPNNQVSSGIHFSEAGLYYAR
ncbi:hypothetical protein [Hyalangium rubrum]|uniref:Secreted protein n=1 Tax=Hyalangium rubrum TaxID=3103134 RepID=A0ABU5H2Y1_9BACT|nr:hypothetical protein [Hyalangium sp. s54d21]MDY7227841.1 hypothetical protein [Hyalangium sp. s54d21]